MSHLRNIVTALSALSVSFVDEVTNTITPTSYDVSAVPASMAAANLPVRLWGTTRGNSGVSLEYVTAGTSSGKVQHNVTELTLLQLVGLSRVVDEWPDTIRYMDALLSVLQTNRSIYAHCEITGANCTRGVFEYPYSSNEQFYGCQTIVNITEYQ